MSRISFSRPFLAALVLSAAACPALSVASKAAEGPSAALTPTEARETLAKATDFMTSIATEGGFLWRYSADLSERAGEGVATDTQIWVQPPGTPSMGMLFLRAHAATHDERYLAAARGAALALVRGQLASGGWDYLIEFDPEKRAQWLYRADLGKTTPPDSQAKRERRNRSTFDDNNTQSALRFLLEYVAAIDAAKSESSPEDSSIREALDYGLRKFLEAQYPNGAWPQRWDGDAHDPARYPVVAASLPQTYPREHSKASYYAHYTLNDHTHRDAVLLMLEAARTTGRDEYREAARRGGEFLLLAQLPAPQSGWAQQYDAAMHPAWARAFEPPAMSSSESAGVIMLLLDLHRGFDDARYLDAAQRAVAWLQASKIGPDRWTRFYELGTNRSIYGDRDGRIHYTLAEISEERQRGYGWEGSFDIPRVIAAVEARAAGEDAPDADRHRSLERLQERARAAAGALDEKGRWLGKPGGRIETNRFLAMSRTLLDYLETAGASTDADP